MRRAEQVWQVQARGERARGEERAEAGVRAWGNGGNAGGR